MTAAAVPVVDEYPPLAGLLGALTATSQHPPGSPYQINYATAINDNGQIVANAYDTNTYQGHALLLTPD